MITQYEVPFLLKKELPQMPVAANLVASRFITTDIYTSIGSFTIYTKHVVDDHQFSRAKKCFAVADKLYKQGDATVRLLIENIFVFAFSSFNIKGRADILMIKTMIPPVLYSVYLKQVTASGC
jgi:hypothetical protein